MNRGCDRSPDHSARPATGFSLDLREITELLAFDKPAAAIRAPFVLDAALRRSVDDLRAAGETVIQLPDGAAFEQDAFVCTRELVLIDGVWQVRNF